MPKPPGGKPPPPPSNTRTPSSSTTSSSSSSSGSSGGVTSAVTKAYRHIAANYGWTLSAAQISKLWKEQISVAELQQRFAALQKVKENSVYFRQFEQVLRNSGVIGKNAHLSLKEAANFVTGSAPNQWYNIWSSAANRATLVNAGIIGVGGTKRFTEKDLALTTAQANLIRDKLGRDAVLSGAGVKQAQTLAAALLHDLPEERYQQFGLNKADFINAVYGGKGSLEAQQQIQQLEANAAARGHEATLVSPNQQQGDVGYTSSTL